MIGEIVDWAGASLPALYLWCAGQAVSRTTYAALFAVLSTTYGVGDGSTTFNIPDRRGRASFGRDNMNGTAANRLTAANSGVTGTTLGATGGDERMPTHNHATTETPHGHTITDPGHTHTTNAVQRGATGSTKWVSGGSTYDTPAATNDTAYTGITNTNNNTTGVSVNNAGLGTAANVPPAFVTNFIIYAAV
jgi:microcystin-dependent protein